MEPFSKPQILVRPCTMKAVDDLSFEIPDGQILGFLGPNGAGKSTTMKMLACYLEPSSGTALINGKDICNEPLEVKSMLGYLPESCPLYGEMTVEEFLGFISDVRQLRGTEKTNAMGRVREMCELDKVWLQSIETLSKGYRQRVGFAQALIHDPPVLILDEPTDGLDPNQKFGVRKIIREMGKNKTIILSTHILEEVEAICQRAVIIAEGRIVADASPAELRTRSKMHNSVLLTLSQADDVGVAKQTLGGLTEVAEVQEIDGRPNTIRVYPKDKQEIIGVISSVVSDKKFKVGHMHVDQGRLDEVFRDVTLGRG